MSGSALPFDDVEAMRKHVKSLQDNVNRCPVCEKDAGNICGVCSVVGYCSAECQRADWSKHKQVCKSLAEFLAQEQASADEAALAAQNNDSIPEEPVPDEPSEVVALEEPQKTPDEKLPPQSEIFPNYDFPSLDLDISPPLLFSNAPPDAFLCAIRGHLISNPVVASCGHGMCLRCVKELYEESERTKQPLICPKDGSRISVSALFPNFSVWTSIPQLKVLCRHGLRALSPEEVNDNEHSKMFGTSGALDWEIDPAGCRLEVNIAERVIHEQTCDYALIPCPFDEACPKIRRGDLMEHQRTCCSHQCAGNSMGCPFRGSRSEVERHKSICAFLQLGPMLSQMNGVLEYMETRFQGLEHRNREKDKEIEHLTHKVAELEQDNNGMNQTLMQLSMFKESGAAALVADLNLPVERKLSELADKLDALAGSALGRLEQESRQNESALNLRVDALSTAVQRLQETQQNMENFRGQRVSTLEVRVDEMIQQHKEVVATASESVRMTKLLEEQVESVSDKLGTLEQLLDEREEELAVSESAVTETRAEEQNYNYQSSSSSQVMEEARSVAESLVEKAASAWKARLEELTEKWAVAEKTRRKELSENTRWSDSISQEVDRITSDVAKIPTCENSIRRLETEQVKLQSEVELIKEQWKVFVVFSGREGKDELSPRSSPLRSRPSLSGDNHQTKWYRDLSLEGSEREGRIRPHTTHHATTSPNTNENTTLPTVWGNSPNYAGYGRDDRSFGSAPANDLVVYRRELPPQGGMHNSSVVPTPPRVNAGNNLTQQAGSPRSQGAVRSPISGRMLYSNFDSYDRM